MNFLIYNPAASSGGALSVLRSFLNDIAKDNNNFYYFVISVDINIEKDLQNVSIIKLNSGYLTRFKWSICKLRLFCSKNKVDVVLSLQNELISNIKIPIYVYVHNILPLVVWEYGNVLDYKLRIKMKLLFWIIKKTVLRANIIFVQTNTFKRELLKKININPNKIMVNSPNCQSWKANTSKVDVNIINIIKKIRERERYIGIFVATDLIYKNHDILLKFCKKWNFDNNKKIELIFTVQNTSKILEKCKEFGIIKYVHLIGSQSKDIIMYLYESTDIVFFPSYIESYPFPLKEALNKNCNIVAADTDFAREICGNNVYYFNKFDVDDLIEKFKYAVNNPIIKKYNCFKNKSFMEIINAIIKDFNNSK